MAEDSEAAAQATTSDENIEEAIYDDLTNGLIKLLRNSPGVKHVDIEHKVPCDKSAIFLWEQENSCQLPQDLKNFYYVTDGFHVKWNCESHLSFTGVIKINPLSQLREIGREEREGKVESEEFNVFDLKNINREMEQPSFGPQFKIFELDDCGGTAVICLVYKCETADWSVWLLDLSLEWHKLADNFTTYYRMLLIHQGLPEWFFKMTPFGVSQTAQQIMDMFAPHLEHKFQANTVAIPYPDWELDPSIFKSRKKQKDQCQ